MWLVVEHAERTPPACMATVSCTAVSDTRIFVRKFYGLKSGPVSEAPQRHERRAFRSEGVDMHNLSMHETEKQNKTGDFRKYEMRACRESSLGQPG
jgi:hypothetical protein